MDVRVGIFHRCNVDGSTGHRPVEDRRDVDIVDGKVGILTHRVELHLT